MKTPRELLFEKHQSANVALDSLRKQVVTEECRSDARNTNRTPATLSFRVLLKLWCELIVPARQIWGGFACAWLAIAVINVVGADRSPRTEAARKAVPAATLMAFKEQQKILAELVGPAEPPDAEKPKTVSPQPRSERKQLRAIG